jgi:4-amino-4-deoxy-L-arabinose transferase-like glycosyltransferase
MDLFKMKKETKILISLLVLALIIRIIFVYSTPIKIWDETVYANLGHDLSNNPFDYSVENNGWSDYIPSNGDDFYTWPKMGFRAPLLPYLLVPFYLFNLDFLIIFFIPVIGTLSVFLIYLLGKNLFNKKTGIYSAIIFLLIPLHIIYSAKILTGVLFTFLILLTFLCFWKGYEQNNKKYKVLFGVFLALALLSRYTALWIMPIFLIYFLIRDKSLKFLKDKYLGYSILAFFGTLIPLFIYGILEYNNPIGSFIHGAKGSGYWGGLQSWTFFFEHWWQIFSIIGFIFIIVLIYLLYKKDFYKKEIYLLLIWFVFFLGMAIYMPHKEDRFILAIVPTIALISGYFINKIKKYKKFILIGIVFITLLSLYSQFYSNYNLSYTDTNKCFLESNKFLETIDKNSIIVTDESSVVYYYTKLETRFYPNPWNYEILKYWTVEDSSNNSIYVLFGNYILKPEGEAEKIKEDLEKNSKKVWECSKNNAYSIIYQI